MVAPNRTITMHPYWSTPLVDFNASEPLLSLAFPTLFRVTPRLRHVPYRDYIRHLMKHESGRFARHPWFRFAAFNTIFDPPTTSPGPWGTRTSQEQGDMFLESTAFVPVSSLRSTTCEAESPRVKHAKLVQKQKGPWLNL
jgi:hypothetical protein